VEALCSEQQIAKEEAGNVIDSAFQKYLGGMVASGTAAPARFRSFARNIQVLRFVWTCLQTMREQISGGKVVSLRSLRNPSSPYYADFDPVFQAVTHCGELTG
jgi:hypothetical protein